MLVICLLYACCGDPLYVLYLIVPHSPPIFSSPPRPPRPSRFSSSSSSSIPIGNLHTPHSSNAPCVLLSCAKVLLFLYACK